MSQVSVVVISKDEPSLALTLEALRPQCAELDAECVVMDASDGRLAAVRAEHPWVAWHDFVGPADRAVTIPHQRNAGVRVAKGGVVAFCDAGGIPQPGWLAMLTRPIVEGALAATGGPIRSLRPSSYGTLNDLATGVQIRRVVTCNFAFSRAIFDAVGGFDERFDYGSDTEFGWRIEDTGEVVTSVAEAIVVVDWGDSRRQLKRDLRYGQAKARQVVLCPQRRGRILRDSPEVIVYPLVVLFAPVVAVASVLTRSWWPVALWSVAVALIVARDLWFGRPIFAAVDHVVVGVGIIDEFARGLLTRDTAAGHETAAARDPINGDER